MNKQLSRRHALKLSAIGAVLPHKAISAELRTRAPVLSGEFRHGVASGDAHQHSVVLWTRVTPNSNVQSGTVLWRVATDKNFSSIVIKGYAATGTSRDWTVKVIASDLRPGETYYFQFSTADGGHSPIGRTKTLPDGPLDTARFAVVSCSNYSAGYFNVYDLISQQDDFDAVIHLGDYIYEYGGGKNEFPSREHSPAHELITLADYRERHSQHKLDAASQKMHARHPLIAIWDDHETADNSWKDGAANHGGLTEGEWRVRKRAALQAYFEWMPVREPEATPEAFFRSFSYGNLLTIAALETRLMARDQQINYSYMRSLSTRDEVERFRTEILWDEQRSMLGDAQLHYFENIWKQSRTSGQAWRLVANQMLMADINTPDLTHHLSAAEVEKMQSNWSGAKSFVAFSANKLPMAPDSWSGYPAARERFYDIQRGHLGGMIVLTGDSHAWWVNSLTDRNNANMGVELGVHSVTSSPAFSSDKYGGRGDDYAKFLAQDNKDVHYVSGARHGYIDLIVKHDTVSVEFLTVSTVTDPAYKSGSCASVEIRQENETARFDKIMF